jgi:hypothetical protein
MPRIVTSKYLAAAGALIALGNTAIAAEQCTQTDWALDADTAHCLLQVDGKIITDGSCRISISRDGREYNIADMNSGTEAQVAMIPTQAGSPVFGLWNRGSKSDTAKMINYGRVRSEPIGKHGEKPWCWHNNRFRMCITAPYLICDGEKSDEKKEN